MSAITFGVLAFVYVAVIVIISRAIGYGSREDE